tara:strand:- start:59 stop:643 length:585 start_codon:yes stop_codon:yes gene_type:complete
MRKILIGLTLIAILFIGGVKRFDYLATKPMDPAEFSWFNKVEIYTGYLAMMAVGFPLYPEISKEMWFMLFSSSEGKELLFEDDFFKDSKIIKKAITNYSQPKRITWNPDNYNLGESEARVALTFNGGTLYLEDGQVIVKVPCAWPQYSNYRDHSEKTPLVRWPEISVQEGLFWVLETERWIYPYTAVWKYETYD